MLLSQAGYPRRWVAQPRLGDLSLAPVTQAWLAVSDDPAAGVTGQYFYHQKRHRVHSAAHRTDLQDELLTYCAGLTAAPLPSEP